MEWSIQKIKLGYNIVLINLINLQNIRNYQHPTLFHSSLLHL
jgi:hypothetical protein